MKKVIIADITTLTDEGKIYGHFVKVARQYLKILSSCYEVKVAGGATYKAYFDNEELVILPYSISKHDNYGNVKGKLLRKWKEFRNARKALEICSDVIIFQCFNETPIYLALLFCKKTNVLMIQYQMGLDSFFKKILYHMIKNKISGIITSTENTGKFYCRPYIVVPDYFPQGYVNIETDEIRYDAVLVGTVSEWKDYQDIIQSFSKTDFKVLIAGKFDGNKKLNSILKQATENITIINRYISDEDFTAFIRSSRYILLPYKKQYMGKSSGILLDAIYLHKPVIATDINTFREVKEYGIGLLYQTSITEVLNEIKNDTKYDILCNNIDKFVITMKAKKAEVINFIDTIWKENCNGNSKNYDREENK